MKLQACHRLYFPVPEILYHYLRGGRRQVEDLRDPGNAYRRVYYYSEQYFQVRDLRARRVHWELCNFELPEDMRYLQPLGEAPEDELHGRLEIEPVRINFTPAGLKERSYGPFIDKVERYLSWRGWPLGQKRLYHKPIAP